MGIQISAGFNITGNNLNGIQAGGLFNSGKHIISVNSSPLFIAGIELF